MQPGDVVAGKFRVDRILGEGGMGVVVAATHLQLDEPVALKFLLEQAVGNAEASAGRSTPGTIPCTILAVAMTAPVLPADTTPCAMPC